MKGSRLSFIGAAALCLVLGACASRPVVVASEPPPTGRGFGALAFSPMTHSQAAASGWSTRDQAEREAVRLCGAADCKVVTWFEHSCAALAASDDSSRWGWGSDHRRDRAEETALQTCGSASRDCRVMRVACTD